jgi:hypothetical protein
VREHKALPHARLIQMKYKRAKPQDFWDGKTSVYSAKKIARAANKIVRYAESLLPYEREELIRRLKEQLKP